MSRPLLEISGLSKHFGGLRAVDDVSFQVLPGDGPAIGPPLSAGVV